MSRILVILGLLSVLSLKAQTPFDPGIAGEASGIREQLHLFTDRNIYAVDEMIYFAAYHRVSGPVGENPWSSVLYVELVNGEGEALIQAKHRLAEGKAEGSLHVPAELLTGNYYLRSYTRWMRNSGPGTFTYIPLKIINPFRSEVQDAGASGSQSQALKKILYKEGILECSSISRTYRPGQEAAVRVKVNPDLFIEQLGFCITVVPAGSVDLSEGQIKVAEPDIEFRMELLPDLGENVTISGTVIGPDQAPVPYKTLHFSMLGENPDYFAALTDLYGRFIISTPTGEGEYKEFFVTPEQDNGGGLEVRIDQEFDSRPYDYSNLPFSLSPEEAGVARRIALNMQLAKAYPAGAPSADEPGARTYSEADRIPFYGTDVKRLLIDDYVRLPNLEEVFINLIPEVQFYRKKGMKKIRIFSDNNSIGVYNPLVMIDHISVFDHDALLAISPEKIERIDLINDIYLKGSVPFGGVLAIHSRKGDMAGIDLPVGSYFFDYQAFHTESVPVNPFPVQEARVPDTRNTLLWSADLQLPQDGQLEIPFRVPTGTGSYVVLVRSVSPAGEAIAASAEFTVE